MATFRSSTIGRRAGWILIVLGLFELLLGAGFFLFAGAVPDEGSDGMLITGAILGLVGIGMVAGGFVSILAASRRDRISATGLPGTAQILSVGQTGWFVNENPQVELELMVNVPGRAAYPAKVKAVVPLIMLSRLEGSLPVRVDPSDPRDIVIQWGEPAIAGGWTPGGIGGGFGPGGPAGSAGAGAAGSAADASEPRWSGPGSGTDETLAQVAAVYELAGATGAPPIFGLPEQANYSVEQIRAWLRANGLAAEATVETLQDSGHTVGDERLFTMDATIRVPGRAPYRTGPSAAMVPLDKVPRIAVGVTVPARVGPDNPHMLMFEWDRI
jgi:hypothetical protein